MRNDEFARATNNNSSFFSSFCLVVVSFKFLNFVVVLFFLFRLDLTLSVKEQMGRND